MAEFFSLAHVTLTGHLPTGADNGTDHAQVSIPNSSAVLGISPESLLGTLLYSTTIVHFASAFVRTVIDAFSPGDTGDVNI